MTSNFPANIRREIWSHWTFAILNYLWELDPRSVYRRRFTHLINNCTASVIDLFARLVVAYCPPSFQPPIFLVLSSLFPLLQVLPFPNIKSINSRNVQQFYPTNSDQRIDFLRSSQDQLEVHLRSQHSSTISLRLMLSPVWFRRFHHLTSYAE